MSNLDDASVDSSATWAAYSAGNASWFDWVEARVAEKLGAEREFSHNVIAEVIAAVAADLRAEFDKALTGLRAQRSLEVVGTYDGSVRYRQLDVVALNGGSFVAKVDDAGVCPGPGWQLIACQGRAGRPGAPGVDGKNGKDAPRIVSWCVNRADYSATPIMSDNSRGPPLELRPLFERFFAETEGTS
jgi:hypothetical protein